MKAKERIIAESLKLFLRYGIKRITMDRISDNLGVSKRTIYELFINKDGLVEACINLLMNEEEKITENIISKSENVIDAFLIRMKRSISVMSSTNEMFFNDIQKYHYSVFKNRGKQYDESEYKMFLRFIKQGKEEGYFRQDFNEKIVAKLIKEQLKIVPNNELFSSEEFEMADVIKNIFINFIRGIATSNGIEVLENYKY